MKRQLWLLIVLSVLASITQFGCGVMQSLQKPETMQDRIAYAEAGLTASYKTITSLSARGRITKAEGIRLLSDADSVFAAINATKAALMFGATDDAAVSLQLALDGLIALEAILKERERK